jgi:hypothetical protein
LRVCDVGLDELKIIAPEMNCNVRSLQLRIVEVIEVIDHRYARRAVANQAVYEMASNKPGSTCYENFVH